MIERRNEMTDLENMSDIDLLLELIRLQRNAIDRLNSTNALLRRKNDLLNELLSSERSNNDREASTGITG